MERIYALLPSVSIIVGIVLVTGTYLGWIMNRFGENLMSVEWRKNNQLKVAWTVSMPLAIVWAPTAEELIFRAPLILAFSAMSTGAWYGVLVSGWLFALAHWFGDKVDLSEILAVRERGQHQSDDVATEMDRLQRKNIKVITTRRACHVVSALAMGTLAGYYGIKYQSIWLAVGIHSAWNLAISVAIILRVRR